MIFMMDYQLTVRSMLERAEKYYPKKVVVSRTLSGLERISYQQIAQRVRRLASSLEKLGVQKGDRVGTLAWNHHRHLEAYFAIPSMGAVLHTINIRLSAEHLIYIINHAEDKVLLIDEDLLPIVEKIHDQLPTVKAFIVMGSQEEVPSSVLSPLYSYEGLLKEGDPDYPFTQKLDENDPAGMCYTSATTGKPKGVVYTHRSIFLHSMALGLKDSMAISEEDSVMYVVPMFHVNAWGMPFASTWFGSKQVLPGPQFTPKVLAELIQNEKVSITAGVPTIWLGLLQELEKGSYDLSSLRSIVCGGSAAPPEMIRTFEKKYGVPFCHAYGMTETSPLVTISRLKSYQQNLSEEEKLAVRAKQGMVVPGLEIRVLGEKGDVKWDGREMGELLVRGPWIADQYDRDERSKESFKDGWLYTGDIVTIDQEGFIKIVDRTKDLIKSGGEWISSVDLENALMAYEDVLEAAVVAVPHPKWQERPLAFVVSKRQTSGLKAELNRFLGQQFPKWWIPDEIIFLKEIPKTSVGKFLKRALREKYSDYYLQSEGNR
jgi:fatty-acyl-CoA synthase